jgi:hypothetical protein
MRAAKQKKQSSAGVAIPALLIAFPVALFYNSLLRHLIDLPYYDDYNALLLFLNQMAQAKSASAKFLLLLAAQHNEYKIFFVHGLAWAQFAMLGHVNFFQLCALGDCAVLPLALLLWWMFLPGYKDLARRLALFVPVAWLLFQLGYWETLTWAMASLQNLWVIVFSFATIRYLLRPSRGAYAGALLLYALSIATSGNGFLLLPIGLLIFAVRRQFARAAGLLAVSAVCIAAYAYHYNVMSSQAPQRGSVFLTLLHMRLDYSIAFAGSAGAIAGSTTVSAAISLVLGIVLLLFFGWMAWRGYVRRNPLVSCYVLFILLTAVGVAGLRSDFGLIQATSSRYTIYGELMVILAWTAFVEEFLQRRNDPLLSIGPYLMVAIVTVLVALWSDGIGYRELVGREDMAVKWMAAYEHPGSPGSDEAPMPPFKEKSELTTVWRAQSRLILNDSIRLGVYEPPRL